MLNPSHSTAAAPPPSPASDDGFDARSIIRTVQAIRRSADVIHDPSDGRMGAILTPTSPNEPATSFARIGRLPPIYPEWLGERTFQERHGTRFAYVAGAMANGIATTRLVIDMARAGMLGFFGAAGLPLPRVEEGLATLRRELGDQHAWGSNLIHSPQEPDLERAVADLYLRTGVRRVSASAYMDLTPAIVRYACSGLTERPDGKIHRENHVFAKISRPEVARRFLSPAPTSILDGLVASGGLTPTEAQLARRVPVAEDFTVEADSGGHTDNQALTAVFPCVMRLRDDLTAQYGYHRPIHIGAAGGLGTPSAVAAAFSLGAAYVLTGSVNQSALQSGLSAEGRQMLCVAGLSDVQMAPAADMFEMGVKVQVLKRGSMFAGRAHRLYDIYSRYASLEAIPADERSRLERETLSLPLDEIWGQVTQFFTARDPKQLEIAAKDPKHKMALIFRWYLGKSSRWAIDGEQPRRLDYQIWCGPAMGAFNDWVRGSFLEQAENRDAVQIALNLLEGAAVITRAQQLRTFGVPVPSSAFAPPPRPLSIA